MDFKIGSGRLIAGLVVVAIGAVFLIGTVGDFDFDVGEVLGWIGAVALIAFGLGILVSQKFQRVVFPLILIGLGVIIILGNRGIDVWQYWPIILIVIGISIIFGGGRRRKRKEKSAPTFEGSSTTTTTADGEVNISCTLGESRERVETDDFIGGSASVTMGEVVIDLRDTTIASPPAHLNVSITMGSMEIRVPSDWVVNLENSVTLGEVQDNRTSRAQSSGTPNLVIVGSLTMGNLQIND